MTLLFANYFRPSLDYQYSYMNNRNKTCVRKFALRIVKRAGNSVLERRRIYCNQWGCDSCGLVRAERLREEIIHKCEQHGLRISLDLTLSPTDDSCCADSFRRIKKSWSKFRHLMNRLPGKKFEYIWVVGVGDAGEAHLHLLTNKPIDQGLLSELWQKCGGGCIVHIKKVRSLIARADYMACNALRRGFLRGSRRFGASKAIKLSVRNLTTSWEAVPGTSIASLIRWKKVLYKRCDSNGDITYCIFKERYNPRREEE